ncbi:MAG: DNA polymerase III subunit beta [Deltaproteobacteria bacterium]|nr:DNA polymerase III subunit beta [Deltaproteobacteria bacterium]
MKFVIEKDMLQTNLGKIQGIAERKSTIPILANTLISGENNRISIVATDLEIGVMEITEATKMEKGEICVSARKFYDIIRELPGDQIEVQKQENFWVSIKAGKTEFNLPGLDPKEFPAFPSTEGTSYFNIDAQVLAEMIEKTVFAASSEESRFNLNGIYIEQATRDKKDYFRMVATDGHRLSMIEKEIKTTFEKGIIISRRGLTELKKILGDTEREITVSLEGNNCIFKTEQTTVVIRLLEGEYPDYHQVIPGANKKQVIIDRREFIGALRRAQVIASEKGEGVKFFIQEESMEIKTGGPDVGNVHEEIKVIYNGKPIEVSFNARYLLDVLNNIDTEKITVNLNEELSPGLIKPMDREDYLYVIMPMRI